jgi:hypothetical protein
MIDDKHLSWALIRFVHPLCTPGKSANTLLSDSNVNVTKPTRQVTMQLQYVK